MKKTILGIIIIVLLTNSVLSYGGGGGGYLLPYYKDGKSILKYENREYFHLASLEGGAHKYYSLKDSVVTGFNITFSKTLEDIVIIFSDAGNNDSYKKFYLETNQNDSDVLSATIYFRVPKEIGGVIITHFLDSGESFDITPLLVGNDEYYNYYSVTVTSLSEFAIKTDYVFEGVVSAPKLDGNYVEGFEPEEVVNLPPQIILEPEEPEEEVVEQDGFVSPPEITKDEAGLNQVIVIIILVGSIVIVGGVFYLVRFFKEKKERGNR